MQSQTVQAEVEVTDRRFLRAQGVAFSPAFDAGLPCSVPMPIKSLPSGTDVSQLRLGNGDKRQGDLMNRATSLIAAVVTAIVYCLAIAGLPTEAMGQETQQSASSRPSTGPYPSLFSGEAAGERQSDIDEAIEILEDTADNLPENDPRRDDLRRAVNGLRRMSKNKKFCILTKAQLAKRLGRPVVLDTPAITHVHDATVQDGQPFPGGKGKNRDGSKDSFIYFSDKFWTEEIQDENFEPIGFEDSGYNGGRTGRNVQDLAVTLWHEWQHVSDGIIRPTATCPASDKTCARIPNIS